MTRRTTMLAVALTATMVWCPSPAAAQRTQPGDTEVFLINYQAQGKDAAAATMLSTFPGFGAGHFYAGYPGRGVAMAAGQAVGLGLVLTGAAVGSRGETSHDVLQVIGLILFAAFNVSLAPPGLSKRRSGRSPRTRTRRSAPRSR